MKMVSEFQELCITIAQIGASWITPSVIMPSVVMNIFVLYLAVMFCIHVLFCFLIPCCHLSAQFLPKTDLTEPS